MIGLALLSTLVALALFGLSTDGHHRRWRGRYLTQRGRRLFRAAAWTLIGVGAIASVAARGWIYGPIFALALTMLAAGAVFLFLNLVPAPVRATSKGVHR